MLVVAFEGWNDAGNAATGVTKFLAEELATESVANVDSEDYYDFVLNRPLAVNGSNGERELVWPGVDFSVSTKKSDPNLGRIALLSGDEPSFRWKAFTAEILEMVEDREIDQVIFLGAMPIDVPHSRPITVKSSSQNADAREALGIEKSQYEGPVGILTVLGLALEAAGIPCVGLWAMVPHYVQNAPSPKATLALLNELELLLGVTFNHSELAEEAFAWEREIDELAESDEDMAAYIAQLEKNRDESASFEESANQLAAEFEAFLRKGEEGDGPGSADRSEL